MHKYERGRVLGKGSFGRAVLAKSRTDGKQVVIKEVSMRNMKPAEREAAKQEAEVCGGRPDTRTAALYSQYFSQLTPSSQCHACSC